MSNTQKKQAKRKARQKAKPKSDGLSVGALVRATGYPREEVQKSLSVLREKKLIKNNRAGRVALSDESMLSMAVHAETGIFVPPSEV